MNIGTTTSSINTKYSLEISQEGNANEFKVSTPFGEVKVLKGKEELLSFIHDQKEKIHKGAAGEGGASSSGSAISHLSQRDVREMANSLKEVGAKIENVIVSSEALGHVKEINSIAPGGEVSGASQREKLVAEMRSKVEEYGSKHTKEMLDRHLTSPVADHQLYLIDEALQILKDLEGVSSFSDMHALYSFPPGIEPMKVEGSLAKDEVELRAGLNSFIQFAIGSMAIDMLVPEKDFPMQHHVLKEFYKDESHPMDLQRFLRTEDRAVQVATVIKNLSIAMNKEEFKAHKVFTGEWESDYNPFIQGMVEARPKAAPGSPVDKSLLEIKTIPPQLERLRETQLEYYSQGGISDEAVQKNYTFSTQKETRGIVLLEKGEAPEAMQFDARTKFIKDRELGVVYLRVADAGDRIVRMSDEGYKGLKAIQKKNEADRSKVQERLTALFADQPSKKVTGRTKSVLGILDKTGRLCERTQKDSKEAEKYQTIRDIIDINGMRITCTDSSELADVIETLKESGFEFLELDNKYNTIRKQGSYKVIPTTVRDTQTGCVFELQLTTVSALSISDLDHNVNYKQKAIGLPLSKKEQEWVSMLSKFSAIVETLNVMGYPVTLASDMSGESLEALSSKVEEYLKTIKVKELIS